MDLGFFIDASNHRPPSKKKTARRAWTPGRLLWTADCEFSFRYAFQKKESNLQVIPLLFEFHCEIRTSSTKEFPLILFRKSYSKESQIKKIKSSNLTFCISFIFYLFRHLFSVTITAFAIEVAVNSPGY